MISSRGPMTLLSSCGARMLSKNNILINNVTVNEEGTWASLSPSLPFSISLLTSRNILCSQEKSDMALDGSKSNRPPLLLDLVYSQPSMPQRQ